MIWPPSRRVPSTVIDPWAVMVHAHHTPLAVPTVVCTGRAVGRAFRTPVGFDQLHRSRVSPHPLPYFVLLMVEEQHVCARGGNGYDRSLGAPWFHFHHLNCSRCSTNLHPHHHPSPRSLAEGAEPLWHHPAVSRSRCPPPPLCLVALGGLLPFQAASAREGTGVGSLRTTVVVERART